MKLLIHKSLSLITKTQIRGLDAFTSIVLVTSTHRQPGNPRPLHMHPSLSFPGRDEDMTIMHMAKHGDRSEDEGDLEGFPSRVEGPKLIRFESPRWRPKTTQVRVHLGVQEQPAP